MNLFEVPYLKYFVFATIAYILIYYLGHIFNSLIQLKANTKYVSLFFKQTFGIIIIVTAYSLIRTGFNSINYISLVVLITILLYQKRRLETQMFISNFELKPILINFVVLFFLFSFSYYLFYIYMNAAVYGDNQFYANIANSLIQKGIESTKNIDWTSNNLAASPYHYTEAWFVAFFSQMFNINPLSVFYLFFIPIFGSVIYQGGIALAQQFIVKLGKSFPLYIYIISGFLFLFIQNISIPFFKIDSLPTYFYLGSWFHNPKLSIIYIIFLSIAILILHHNYKIAFAFILLLIPLYSPIVLPVISGIILTLSYLYFIKNISIKIYLMYMSLTILTLLGFLLFYYFQLHFSISSSNYLINIFKIDVIFFNVFRIVKCHLPPAEGGKRLGLHQDLRTGAACAANAALALTIRTGVARLAVDAFRRARLPAVHV